MLKVWKANFDIRPVLNYYSAVSYMFAFFLKSESGTSQALIQTLNDVKSQTMNARESIHKLSSVFATSRQIFPHESVYFSLDELWLCKYYPKCAFANTNITLKKSQNLQIPEIG